jgi:hypothetical protein
MNQAEVIRASSVHRDKPNLSLLDASYDDVRDAFTLDVELKEYESGKAKSQKKHNEQIKRASQLGKGMSPHSYELVILPTKAKLCYGCGNQFVAMYWSPPYNVLVKHFDRRVIKRNEQNGQLLYSTAFSNTYYHPNSDHIKRKNPVFHIVRIVQCTRRYKSFCN